MNGPAQAGRTYDVQMQTEARARPCLEPECSALYSSGALL